MTSRVRHLLAPALILMVLAFPVATAQASPSAVIRDCAEDGSVDGHYSKADLKAALKQIPADLDEYSDCKSAITSAMGATAKATSSKKSGGGGGASSGGSSSSGGGSGSGSASSADTNGDGTVSAAEKAAAGKTELAQKTEAKRVHTDNVLGNPKTDPAKVGAIDASDTSNGLPVPVILSIAALALLAAAAGLLVLGRRKPGFAQALRRVPLPARFRR
jgi:cobalamin biosynthesis Mg chelatase CobN